jgi:hypothetical protein
LWGNQLTSPEILRNHLLNAFAPHRWPAFCAKEQFRLPLCYKPGYGLGLVEPESRQINAGIILRFVRYLREMLDEPRNVLIHCVSFLHQMLLLEIHQYGIKVPEDFHICNVAPELIGLLTEAVARPPPPPPLEKKLKQQYDNNPLLLATINVQNHIRNNATSPSTVVTTDTRDTASTTTTNTNVISEEVRRLRESLLAMSQQASSMLSSRYDIVDGKLIYHDTTGTGAGGGVEEAAAGQGIIRDDDPSTTASGKSLAEDILEMAHHQEKEEAGRRDVPAADYEGVYMASLRDKKIISAANTDAAMRTTTGAWGVEETAAVQGIIRDDDPSTTASSGKSLAEAMLKRAHHQEKQEAGRRDVPAAADEEVYTPSLRDKQRLSAANTDDSIRRLLQTTTPDDSAEKIASILRTCQRLAPEGSLGRLFRFNFSNSRDYTTRNPPR